MPRAPAPRPDLPPLLALEVRGRLSVLAREHHELRRRLVQMAPRSLRRLRAEADLAALTRQILAAELALGRKVRS
ncbi:hypothetical protein [Ancylobacter sp. G4_0304]|uniref:hypothetical protein n=1 Tax=Ancylobacter sp. G4_0304 TaxID=3114289 RepID=UPI0039C7082B